MRYYAFRYEMLRILQLSNGTFVALTGAVWAIALLISLALFSDGSSANRAIFDVMSYGAKGDGITNDAPAFLKAWKDVCSSKENHPVLLIPARKSFVLSSIEFKGPCTALSVGVSVSGNVLSSTNKMDWKTCQDWISFTEIANLEVHGSGIIDGNGAKWWKDELSCGKRPTNFALNRCINASLRGIHSKDSARNHISVAHCKGVTISHITITAPADSPNTDGIDISSSTHVTVTDSHIGSGDDCIAINNHCNNINITKIVCGPGHGISVGSLGKGGEVAEVEDIYVHNCTLVGTANGARVKTWKVGKGYARRITYSDIILKNVRRPIIIDQTYVNRYQKPRGSSVAISDVKFLKFEGTCQKNDAITLKCNDLGPGCIDIEISDVTITSATRSPVKATCQNAHGRSMRTQPKVTCLNQKPKNQRVPLSKCPVLCGRATCPTTKIHQKQKSKNYSCTILCYIIKMSGSQRVSLPHLPTEVDYENSTKL
ncbi:unnamed protein product [Rhodiola kirilowii]